MSARRAFVALVAAAAWLGACAASAPPAALFPPPLVEPSSAGPRPADASALLDRARAYGRTTGDFTARVAVSLRELDRGMSFASRGAVAVRRPGAMRMQLAGPGGVTALDVLARDGVVYSRVAGRAWVREALAGPAPREGAVPAGAIARAFLGLDWDHATVVRVAGALALARAPSGDGGVALVAFEAGDGAVREVRWLDARGDERARVRFAALEPVAPDGARFPATVLYWQRAPRVSATIAVEHRERAPTLPDATFAVPADARSSTGPMRTTQQ